MNLPGLDPFLGTRRGWAALSASRHPCPWVAGEDALEPRPCNGNGLSGTPWWRSFKVPPHHPTPTGDSKLDGARLVECSASLLFIEEARPLFLAIFYYSGFFWGTTFPFSVILFSFLFFFKLGMGSKLTVGGGKGRGGEQAEVGTLRCPYSSLWGTPSYLFSYSRPFSLRPLSCSLHVQWRD